MAGDLGCVHAIKLSILPFLEIRICRRLSSGCEASLFKDLGIAGATALSAEFLADQTGGRDLHVFRVDGGSEKPQYRDQTGNKQGIIPFWFGLL